MRDRFQASLGVLIFKFFEDLKEIVTEHFNIAAKVKAT